MYFNNQVNHSIEMHGGEQHAAVAHGRRAAQRARGVAPGRKAAHA